MNKYTLSIKDLSSKEMQYNTQQKRMPLPEYGRSIQNMVDYALTIQDRAERQRCANTIINIMGNMFPHLRDVPDFKHKLWDHLAIMADFKLDIDYPSARTTSSPVRIISLTTLPVCVTVTTDIHWKC